MSRLFRRGELKAAVLEVIAEEGPLHGYGVLSALAEAIDTSWRPSPGSVYPAIIALEDMGLIAGVERDDSRIYAVTAAGRAAILERRGVLESVRRRAESHNPSPTIGQLVDRFATQLQNRAIRLDEEAASAAQSVLQRAEEDLVSITESAVTRVGGSDQGSKGTAER